MKVYGFLILGGLLVGGGAWGGEAISEARQRQLKARYDYLFKARREELPDGSLRFHQGRLWRRHGLNILHVKGDIFEMAFQHGALLKEVIPYGAVPAAARTMKEKAANRFPHNPAIATALDGLIHRFITVRMLNFTERAWPDAMESYQDLAFALSSATGVDSDTFLRAAMSPETLMVAATMTMKDSPSGSAEVDVPASCTSFSAWGSATPDGEMVIGRNLDFPLNGSFDRYPTMIYFEPKEGQRIFAASSAGVHNPAITAVNESGIFLGLHTLPTTHASAKGIPIFLSATRLLSTARNFDEAVAQLLNQRSPSGWTYHVASLRERRAGSVEFNNERAALRESKGGVHAQANHYLTDWLKPQLLHVNNGFREDSEARYQRALEVLEAQRGSVTKDTAVALLADHVDPFTGNVTAVPNTISVHTTVGSVVVAAGERRIYAATGMAPVSENPFYGLPLPEDFDPETFGSLVLPRLEAPSFAVAHPKLAQGESHFIEAKKAFENRNDLHQALGEMRQAREADPENVHYGFVYAMLSLRAGEQAEAVKVLGSLLHSGASRHQRHLALYFLGRIAADARHWEGAEKALEAILEDGPVDRKLEPAVEEAVGRVRGRRRLPLKTKALPVLFQQGDVEHY